MSNKKISFDQLPPPIKEGFFRRIWNKVKWWWLWNIKLRRKIPFPAIKNASWGIPIDDLVSENQYTYTTSSQWWKWIPREK